MQRVTSTIGESILRTTTATTALALQDFLLLLRLIEVECKSDDHKIKYAQKHRVLYRTILSLTFWHRGLTLGVRGRVEHAVHLSR